MWRGLTMAYSYVDLLIDVVGIYDLGIHFEIRFWSFHKRREKFKMCETGFTAETTAQQGVRSWKLSGVVNNRYFVEHIQNFFVVLQSSESSSFDVFLVNENDAFSYASQSKQGLLDLCIRDNKFIRLTSKPSSTVDLLNTYTIIDMDIMRVFQRAFILFLASYSVVWTQLLWLPNSGASTWLLWQQPLHLRANQAHSPCWQLYRGNEHGNTIPVN